MFEEFLNSGFEVRVVFRNATLPDKDECLFGEVIEVGKEFIKLLDHRKHKFHYVRIEEIISIGER